MKVFMLTDLEGVAGVVSFDKHVYSTGEYYEKSMSLLTGEVNAATEGLLEAGVDEIIVWDGHGDGGIVFEEMHSALKLIHGAVAGLRNKVYDIMKTCDVGVMIGQHAMAGVSNGNLNHTQCSQDITEYRLNDVPIGEIAQFTLSLGSFGIPMIYLSGDTAACQEAEELIQKIKTTSVKDGIGRNAAVCLSHQASKEKIHNDIITAINNHAKSPISPIIWTPPYNMQVTCTNSSAADRRASTNNRKRINDLTFCAESNSILDVIYG